MHPLWAGLLALFAWIGAASAQPVILSQPPNQTDAVLSDVKLQDFPLLPNPTGATAADNFALAAAGTVARITVWGVYIGAAPVPDTDRFSVQFHSDESGFPGSPLATRAGVAVTRSATGELVSGGRVEYQYLLQFDPVPLDPGTYWVEVANDTSGTDASFYWSFGNLDPVAGIPGAVSRLTAITGADWEVIETEPSSGPEARPDLAIVITTLPAVQQVPTLAGWWVAMLAVLLGIGALRNLRTARPRSD